MGNHRTKLVGMTVAVLLAAACRTTGPGMGAGPLPPGVWGADAVGMTVTDTVATLVFACAVGRIPGRIVLDEAGQFRAEGVYAFTPGPLYLPHPSRYEGTVRGAVMTLTVIVTDEPQPPIGPFQLQRGVQGPTSPLCL